MLRRASNSIANAAMPVLWGTQYEAPQELSMQQKDSFYGHQLASKNVYSLDEHSLYAGGVADGEGIGKRIFHKLQKNNILTREGIVDTTQIGPKFTHQIAIITTRRQKQLLDLLFWWEEECHRLKKLEAEKYELDQLVKVSRDEVNEHGPEEGRKEHLDQYVLLQDRVKMKIRQRPSQRLQDMEMDRDEVMMRYRHGVQPENVVRTEPPPEYR